MAVLIWALALRTLDLGDQSILLGRMSKRLSRFNAVGNEHEWMHVLLDDTGYLYAYTYTPDGQVGFDIRLGQH